MELLALPALNDNYVWLLHDGRQALAVDPGDSAPVLRALAAPAAPANGRLTLAGILLTHHHADHTGGAAALHAATGAPVFGPAQVSLSSPTPAPLTVVQGGDAVPLLGLQWQVLAVPGHTATHVTYFCERVEANGVSAPLLFCGDALFSGGCGRVFEGTPAQMLASLDAPRCPMTPACAAATNTRWPMCALPAPWSLITRNLHIGRRTARRCAKRAGPRCPAPSGRKKPSILFCAAACRKLRALRAARPCLRPPCLAQALPAARLRMPWPFLPPFVNGRTVSHDHPTHFAGAGAGCRRFSGGLCHPACHAPGV